jgi:hypothetical protein
MINPSHNIVLRTAYIEIQREFQRIRGLLKLDGHPLGEEYGKPISANFQNFETTAEHLLDDMKQAITSEEVATAWQKYVRLKTEVIPLLSSELLAIIGGAFLQVMSLDDIRVGRADSPEGVSESAKGFSQRLVSRAGLTTSTQSFSLIAKRLATDLGERSNKMWTSVLIVGEERIGYVKAEIIRLRFPACDLWKLPFTAHEYGYLVAENHPPEGLVRLKERVSGWADPRAERREALARQDLAPYDEENPDNPPDPQCFLRLRGLWREYEEKKDPVNEQELERELREGRTRLQSDLCRLFADAFATLLVGPAYVYALLCLRFVPDETLYEPSNDPLPRMPPFAHRFVFALETLRWIDRHPELYRDVKYDLEKRRSPFIAEVERSAGILPVLWRETLASANCEDRYDAIAKAYQPWLRDVHGALYAEFCGQLAGKGTLKHWLSALDLETSLTEFELRVSPPRPSMWAVLNAAWSARIQLPLPAQPQFDAQYDPDQRIPDLENIEANSLRLLIEEDEAVLKAPAAEVNGRSVPPQMSMLDVNQKTTGVGGAQSISPSRVRADREADIQLVNGVLERDYPPAWALFVTMQEQGAFERRGTILQALTQLTDRAPLDAYKRLYETDSPRSGAEQPA